MLLNELSKKMRSFKSASRQKKVNFIVLAMGIIEPLFTLPQAYSVWIKHETVGVSFTTWFFFTVAAVVWCVYGFTIDSKPLVISYALYTIFNGFVVVGLLVR